MSSSKSFQFQLITMALLLLLSSCGYRSLSSPTPFNATSFTVIPFHEKEPIGFSQNLSNQLSIQLARSGVALSKTLAPTGALLRGTVQSATVTGNPASALDRSIPSFQISLRLIATLEDSRGKTLWTKSYAFNDSFLQNQERTPQSVLITESGKRTALHRLAEIAAKRIHTDLMVAQSLYSHEGTSLKENENSHATEN